MGTRTVLHTVGGLALAAAGIFASLTVGASCILHDKDIVVLRDGFKWCANAEGAQGWDGDPDDAVQLLDSDGLVIQGCGCFDDDEHAQLEDWDANGIPSPGAPDFDQYVILRDEILLAARAACVDRAEALGFANNDCVASVPDNDDIFSNGTSGACHYEELVADTDGGTSSAPQPFDLSGLTCDAGSCRAQEALVDDMFARPEAFLLDDARVEFDTDGSLVFTTVSPGDAVYIAGIRSGDRLLKINGEDALSLDDVAELLPDFRNDGSATITIKDSYGDEITISLLVY